MLQTHINWKRVSAVVPFALLVGVSVALYVVVTPETIIEYVGVENAYLLIAFLGGLTTFNTVPYYSVLLLLASGGLNPFVLGLASASGVMCGDSVSYLVGYHGAAALPRRLRALFERIYTFAQKHPRLYPIVCFVYGSICPLSNDFITIPAGMARIPYLRVMAPLALGNLVFNVGVAYAVTNIYSLF